MYCKPLWTLCLGLFAITGLSGVVSRSASAQTSSSIPTTYKVQVEYWFWDSDYYHWSTVLETNSQTDALFMYDVLAWAHDAGDLNQVAPHNFWKYIAVDVRLVSSFNLYQGVKKNTYTDRAYYLRH